MQECEAETNLNCQKTLQNTCMTHGLLDLPPYPGDSYILVSESKLRETLSTCSPQSCLFIVQLANFKSRIWELVKKE